MKIQFYDALFKGDSRTVAGAKFSAVSKELTIPIQLAFQICEVFVASGLLQRSHNKIWMHETSFRLPVQGRIQAVMEIGLFLTLFAGTADNSEVDWMADYLPENCDSAALARELGEIAFREH